MKLIRVIAVMVSVLVAGCTTTAPTYQASFENVQKLKSVSTVPVKIGIFTADSNNKDRVENLTIRGGSFLSPYDGSYASYLREALRQEFYDAGRLSDTSNVVITGVLLNNEIDASGFSIGTAAISAQFTVSKDSQVRYNKIMLATHQWESAFAAANAVPKAHQNYPVVVQKLLSNLYGDVEFQKATK